MTFHKWSEIKASKGVPTRIQRRRTKGWRMPPNTVYVGRPSRWGNPWRVDDDLGRGLKWDPETVVALYRHDMNYFAEGERRGYGFAGFSHRLAELRGKSLACWCPLDQPCHADVLLELANA